MRAQCSGELRGRAPELGPRGGGEAALLRGATECRELRSDRPDRVVLGDELRDHFFLAVVREALEQRAFLEVEVSGEFVAECGAGVAQHARDRRVLGGGEPVGPGDRLVEAVDERDGGDVFLVQDFDDPGTHAISPLRSPAVGAPVAASLPSRRRASAAATERR